MKKIACCLLLILPALLSAQKTFDLTGRISIKSTNVDYNEQSDIKPDSIDADQYGKTSLIPGFQQTMNLALFGRTKTLDMSLLGDIRNNTWNSLDPQEPNSIDRLSFSLRFDRHEIILGDFYESGSPSGFFVQSREVRGGKVHLYFDELWNKDAFFEIRSSFGISQRQLDQGDRLNGIYKQFESTGLYRRLYASGSLVSGEQDFYKVGLNYLYAKDDENSISASLNEPLSNTVLGADGDVYVWKRNLKLFGEGFFSTKDTLDGGGSEDNAYKGGVDFQYEGFNFVAFYQRIGFDYYSAGFPFLLNDRQGFRIQTGYSFNSRLLLGVDLEQYEDNLDDINQVPTSETRRAEMSLTAQWPSFPQTTVLYGYRDDLSNSVFNEEMEETKTDKISHRYELRLSHSIDLHRFSVSGIYLDLDDFSKIAGGAPLGTEQVIGSFNFYTRFSTFSLSGGGVYSRLLLSDGKDNRNYFVYQTSRWDIMRGRLVMEATANYSINDAQNGGTDDLLSDYDQINAQLSLEYFFNTSISLKAIAGTDSRNMRYSTAQARAVIADPDIDPTFFNGNESYNALIYGLELNWMF